MPSTPNTSLYDVLGVSRDASTDEIRRAYKSLAREKHPDRGGDAESFKAIQQAHETLSDDGKRRLYDITGSTDGDVGNDGGPGMAAGGIPFHFMGGMGPFGMPGVAFDIGEMFGGLFGGGGGGGGGPGANRRTRAGKGPNKHSDINLRLSDFYNGREIKIRFNQSRRCGTCAGSGAESMESCGACGGRGMRVQTRMIGPGMMAQSTGPCDVCSGEGKRIIRVCNTCHGKRFLEREKELVIRIESGMTDGQTIVFPGECSESAEFEQPGDVVLTLRRVDEEAGWEWRGDDLYAKITVTFGEAILGFRREIAGHPSGAPFAVEWCGGPIIHGTTLHVKGHGMPRKGRPAERGAVFVEVNVAQPDSRTWTEAEKEQLRTMFGVPDDTIVEGVVQLSRP